MSLFTFGTKTTTGPAFSFASSSSSSATPLTAGPGGGGGRTALHAAALHGDVVAVSELLRGGADPDAADDNGTRALHVAAAGDRADMCELLLAAGADIGCVDWAGDTALHLAAGCGGVATVRVLLGWGAAAGAGAGRVVNGRGKTARVVAEEAGWGGVVALLPDGGWRAWERVLEGFGAGCCAGRLGYGPCGVGGCGFCAEFYVVGETRVRNGKRKWEGDN